MMITTRRLGTVAFALLALGWGLPAPAQEPPQAVPGLEAWYRADSLQLNNGDSVTQWPDRSGNGHDLTDDGNGVPASFATVQLNRHPVVQVRQGNSYSVTAPFDLGEHTIFLVYRTGLTERALFRSETDESYGVLLRTTEGRDVVRGTGGRSVPYGTLSAPGGGDYGITVLGRAADRLHEFVNGKDVSSGAEFGETLRVGKFFDLARSRFVRSDGDGLKVAEIMIYGRFLADEERSGLTGYLAERYAIGMQGAAPPAPGTLVAAAAGASTRRGLALLRTTAGVNVNQPMLGVPWSQHEMLESPFRHDRKTNDSRLFCTKDDTRVRLYVSLPLKAEQAGVNVRVLFSVNGGKLLSGAGLSGSFGGAGGAGMAVVRAETVTTLNAGDYVEVVTIPAGGEGEAIIGPDAAIFIAQEM